MSTKSIIWSIQQLNKDERQVSRNHEYSYQNKEKSGKLSLRKMRSKANEKSNHELKDSYFKCEKYKTVINLKILIPN